MYQYSRDKQLHTVGSDFVLSGHSLRRGACGVSGRGLCARLATLVVLLINVCLFHVRTQFEEQACVQEQTVCPCSIEVHDVTCGNCSFRPMES